MSKTKIEWADMTINPIVGCSKCSPGCDNCYAEKMAYRLSKMPATAAKYAGVVDENGWTGKINFDLSVFDKLPKKPQRIFVGSMTDLFVQKHEVVQYSKTFLPELWDRMSSFPQHTFLLLTKHPKNMKAWLDYVSEAVTDVPEPNIGLGATVCNQQEANEKIPILLQTPAAKRFVSIEPTLNNVSLTNIPCGFVCEGDHLNSLTGTEYLGDAAFTVPSLDWVICGGETGPGARPMHPDWVRNLRDQCQAAGVPFFFKGWGEYIWCEEPPPGNWQNCLGERKPEKPGFFRAGKKRAGRILDGREWNEFPK